MLRRSSVADQKGHRAATKRSLRSILSGEQFRWALERESQRVDRLNSGDLTLLLFRVSAGQRRLSSLRLARTILSRIRITDDIGWYDREHLGVLLPETSVAGAWHLSQAICEIVARRGPRPLCTMYNYPALGEDADAAAVVRAEPADQLKVAS